MERGDLRDLPRQRPERRLHPRWWSPAGVGDLGLAPGSARSRPYFVIASKISLYPQEYYENGLAIVTVPTRRIGPRSLPPTVKSLNYLNNILAKIEAKQFGALEAIMLNEQGYVAEARPTMSSSCTRASSSRPSASQGALKGITRSAIMDIARELGIPEREANLTRYDLWCADECFLTGTGAEVIPVVKLDGRTIGDGRPGPVTRRVLAEFRKRVLVEGTRI